MVEYVTDFFGSLSPAWFYFALFTCAYIENVFPPIPGDTVTVFGAYIVARSQQKVLGVFVATTLGSMAGFMTYYAVGRLVPLRYFTEGKVWFLPAASVRKAGDWFQRFGYWLILGNRFLSGIRSVISIVAGVYRLPWPRVLVLATIGCAVWNALLIWTGYFLGANWRVVEELLREYTRFVLILLVLLACGWLLRRKIFTTR
jgi:membrane protein DedA with SNARE-associated domain